MNTPESNNLSTAIAILIAIVTVVGAIAAWRVAVSMSDAGTADTLGLLAAVEKEDVTTQATITVAGHRMAYTAYVRDDALATSFDEVYGANADRGDLSNLSYAFRLAANYALDFIPANYVGRDEKLDISRDLGENIAQLALARDINPQPHFDAADTSRTKALWLLTTVILLGVVLILLTLADAVQNFLRYVILAAGLGLFGISTLLFGYIEFVGFR